MAIAAVVLTGRESELDASASPRRCSSNVVSNGEGSRFASVTFDHGSVKRFVFVSITRVRTAVIMYSIMYEPFVKVGLLAMKIILISYHS